MEAIRAFAFVPGQLPLVALELAGQPIFQPHPFAVFVMGFIQTCRGNVKVSSLPSQAGPSGVCIKSQLLSYTCEYLTLQHKQEVY